MSMIRSKWAAVGAAVAVTLGAGGVSLTQAAITTGDKPVYIALDAPCRVLDTRFANPIGAGATNTLTVQITGNSGDCTDNLAVPNAAIAVATNVTAIQPNGAPSGRSFFTVYPANATLPTTSNLNFINGQPPAPNKVDVGLSTTGQIKIYNNQGTAHAAVDIFGYYIDHHHDDRYYTEIESDDRYYTRPDADDRYYTRPDADDRYYAFGGSLLSAIASGGAIRFDTIVAFPNAGSPTMLVSFGIPPERDSERPILVHLPFDGPPNCSIVLTASGAAGPFLESGRFLNAGWSVAGSPAGVVVFGPAPAGSSSSTAIVTMSHNSADRLGGATSVELRLVRDATNVNDTCPFEVFARGGYSVEY